MKLRNKKTGEIVECFNNTDGIFPNSLAELNAEWEDYEEPKPWWYIDITLDVKQGELFLSKHVEQFKTVGNYFETREEADKAVEKLKAWKRLKDKGFRVIDYGDEDIRYEIKDRYNGCLYDLETVLFGGEE